MAWDGLINPYDKQAMGVFGEQCVGKYGFTREEQDAYAAESVRRAQGAVQSRRVQGRDRSGHRRRPQGRRRDRHRRTAGQVRHRQDPDAEACVQEGRHDHRRQLLEHQRRRRRAGADVGGRSRRSAASSRSRGSSRTPRIRRRRSGSPPRRSSAIANVLEKAGWKVGDVDLFEVNEAFACVAMAPMRELGIPHEKLNVNGGAVRARPSDRCQRRASDRHAAARAAGARRQAWRGRAVHRRRRSDRDGGRDRVKI